MSDRITICEMSPRDGMQVLNRANSIPIELRAALLHALQRAGFPYIEAGSFVSPKFLPHMADSPRLLAEAKLPDYRGQLAALVPNVRFYEQFKDTPNLATVALFLSASETYSQKNKKVSIAEDLADARQVAAMAKRHGHGVRAHLSAAFRDVTADGAPTDPDLVARTCRELIDAGCELVALADTDGRATPLDVRRVIEHLAARGIDVPRHVGVHLHDRFGVAIASAWEAFRLGVRTFDAAVGGIGGAAALSNSVGHIATEQLVQFFDLLGVETGIDHGALRDALTIVHRMTQLAGDPRPTSKLMDEILAAVART